ncbi:MAG TPA: DUF1570 domain-containing protein [Planctomycetota bacterium]|nr:DUF1570 domain-containing protein [Planctomycetota bacterium]
MKASRIAAAVLLLTAFALAGDERVKEGQWSKRDVPKGWTLSETEHYQVQCSIGGDTGKKLGEHLEHMLTLYSDFMPTRRKLETFILKVFPNKKDFCEYGGYPLDTPTVAYYKQDTKELIGYDCGFVFGKRTIPAGLRLRRSTGDELSAQDRERLDALFEEATNAYTMDLVRVLAHEGWHQYFHFYTVSWVPMPQWLDEGVGDYFYMAPQEMKDGSQPAYSLGTINMHRLRRVRRGLVDGETTPFEAFMEFDQEAYYKNGSLNYAQGWSMVHFLLQNPDPLRRELIPRLIKDFKDTKNFHKSTDKVFKGEDYDKLDQDWIGWLLSQPIDDPLLTMAREFGDRVKPEALEGDARLIDVYKWYLEHPAYPGDAASAAPAAQDG